MTSGAVALLVETGHLLAALQPRPAAPPDANAWAEWRERVELSPDHGAVLEHELVHAIGQRRAELERILDHVTKQPAHVAMLEAFLERGVRDGVYAPKERLPRMRDLPRCGARARSRGGAPCRGSVVCRRDALGRVMLADRCHLHGGLSTGPTTAEGRKRCAQAARKRWARWRAARALSADFEDRKKER